MKVEKGNKATDWTPAPEDVQAEIDANASALSDFEGVVTTSISGLQAQIDGVVDSWFYAYTPTTANYPASEWTTTELKQRHVGDTLQTLNPMLMRLLLQMQESLGVGLIIVVFTLGHL